ncbi:MAG TPA: hypothetical protein VMB85_17680 [Bryobacteraceae bacterium]|nr:hypothetical protein [Bryobacteraceae bacterium]
MDASSIGSQREVSRAEFDQLASEVRDLAHRLSAVEQFAGAAPQEAPPVPHVEVSSDLVPALGKALLAMAGGYLLRAFTDLHLLPAATGAACGILYAGVWLWLAARSSGKITARLFALTSMFLLAPLLWEASSRLQAIPPWAAALLLALVAIATARRPLIAPITTVAGALTALTLLIALRHLTAFSLSILAIAACAEWAESAFRWIVALLADLAVVIFTVVLVRGVPDGYPAVSAREAVIAQSLLVLIYAGGLFVRRRAFTFFEIFQAACAFLIGAGGAFYLTRAPAPVAWFLIAASAACYAFLYFGRVPRRNLQAFAAFSLALALAGTYLAASGLTLVVLWSALGVALAFTHLAAFHAWVYLWSAALVSSVAMNAKTRIWEDADAPFTLEAFILLISALAAYLALSRAGRIGSALPAAAAGSLFAAAFLSRFAPGALVLTLLALALAWAGARAARRELRWLSYGLMTLAAAKILLHDFARGSMALVIPLLGYGIALILLPRILQRRRP